MFFFCNLGNFFNEKYNKTFLTILFYFSVCIMNFNQGCFSMNSNRLRGTFRLILDILEKQGYAAVSLNINEFMTTPTHERTPYLMREIGYKCGEIGLKLSAA